MDSVLDWPNAKSPLANMPALTELAAKSTYTMVLRVCKSTVGANLRTLPVKRLPSAAIMLACMPTLIFGKSLEITSARHSKRDCRINRNSSVPAPTTAPTVALRAEIMPLSGA